MAGQTIGSRAILIKLDATGTLEWYKTYDGVSSLRYMVLSGDNSKLIVQGQSCDGCTIGAFALTMAHGPYTAFIAAFDPSDGSVLWAVDAPITHEVRLSPDGTSVYAMSQTTGNTDVLNLTDHQGQTTMLRSLGSWDLVAMKLDASNGAGIWAIDGGGGGMEYFHG